MAYHIRPRILRRQHLARLGCGDLELGDDGDGLDLGGPAELDVVADAVRRRRRLRARVDAPGRRGEHLAQRDLDAGHVLGRQRLEVGAHEAAKEGSAHVVRVAFWLSPVSASSSLEKGIRHSKDSRRPTDHQTKVKQALGREVVQAAALLAQHDAGDDGGP